MNLYRHIKAFFGPRDIRGRDRVKAPILLPFALLLVFVVGAFLSTAYRHEKWKYESDLTASAQAVEQLFEQHMEEDSRMMLAALDAIIRNGEVKAAFLARDREALYRLVRPLFEALRGNYGITHFYFTGADRVNFLRVHKPDRYGDVVGRVTTLKAEETGKAAAGVELGPLGTLTLRAVIPWRDAGKLIGFVELGHEIGHVSEEMSHVLGIDLMILVYKSHLDREGWEASRRMLGREGDWDRFPASVVFSRSMERMPRGVAGILETGKHTHQTALEMEEDGKRLYVMFLPLFDAAGSEVGDFIVIREVTALAAAFREPVTLTVIFSLLAGGIVFALFYWILGRVEGDVRGHAKRLSDEIVERERAEEALRKAHGELEFRVEERTRELRDEITEHKRAEEALRQSQASLANAQRIASLGNWEWDSTTGEITWSEEHYRIFGLDPRETELTVDTIVNIVHPDDREAFIKAGHRILEEGGEYDQEYRIVRPDGSKRIIHSLAEIIRDETGKPSRLLGTVLDITERKQAQAQLIQASKLATLGEMATGMAHELNQPLNVIRMAADNTLERIEEGKADAGYLQEKLERISDQIERAARIIDHMRIFGRKAGEKPEKFDPRKVVENVLGLMGEQLRLREIGVETELPEHCRGVLGHALQLEQVVLNLLTNARDAIEANRTSPGAPKKLSLIVEDMGPENTVRLTVRDSGGGISEEVLPRIFESFYTTKKAGEGTGLGLSVSYGIVRDMGGTIEAANTGQGARFTITLPVLDDHGGAA